MLRDTIAKLARSTAVHVAVGFLAMGCWAAWVNAGHGAGKALIAGLLQGAISGAITLVLKRSLEAMAARLPGALAFVAPPAVTCIAVLTVLVGAHLLARTPDVPRTIALPYAVSSTYAWIYSFSLYARRRRAETLAA